MPLSAALSTDQCADIVSVRQNDGMSLTRGAAVFRAASARLAIAGAYDGLWAKRDVGAGLGRLGRLGTVWDADFGRLGAWLLVLEPEPTAIPKFRS